MRRAHLLFLVAAATAVSAQAADPGPTRGFRDLSWGDAPTTDMYQVDMEVGGMQAYLRKGSDGSVGGLPPAFIAFLFFERRFCRVEVGWESGNATRDLSVLADAFSVGWGAPDGTTPTSRLWRSSAPRTVARLGIERASPSGRSADITLTVLDEPCAREAERTRLE